MLTSNTYPYCHLRHAIHCCILMFPSNVNVIDDRIVILLTVLAKAITVCSKSGKDNSKKQSLRIQLLIREMEKYCGERLI